MPVPSASSSKTDLSFCPPPRPQIQLPCAKNLARSAATNHQKKSCLHERTELRLQSLWIHISTFVILDLGWSIVRCLGQCRNTMVFNMYNLFGSPSLAPGPLHYGPSAARLGLRMCLHRTCSDSAQAASEGLASHPQGLHLGATSACQQLHVRSS